jgi:THAP4-like, heme-binding beta-barrel domain
MTTAQIGMTPTAKEVTALGRRFRLHGDELSYSLQMGAVGQPTQHHLAAVLHRND